MRGAGALPACRQVGALGAVRLRYGRAGRADADHERRVSEAAERPNVTLHVLPFGTGLHSLDSTDMMFLRLVDGRTVAYTENDVRGELVEETSRVERLHRTYDAVRDLALSPAESRTFILRMLEEVPCEPST
ncbi:Scr1 family TA system antitoxin-like transcriptional regulator [Streptomyces sp. NPDC048256]|uniref:Scr1 family TA system antitoxin-like transcriptional regulator n=1 Tax=Streptomyces sp. NPDC048256 TaxID=3154613 RepID=UPI00340938EE